MSTLLKRFGAYDPRELLRSGFASIGIPALALVLFLVVWAELAARIGFHTPDEKEKRHGQAIAAASLPVVR